MININRKYFMIEATAVVLILVIAAAVMIPRFLQAQNFNTPGNFPDPLFRIAVESYMKVERGGFFTKANLASIQRMQLQFPQIENYKGLEHFTGLTHLDVITDKATELDLSNNKLLESLIIAGVQLNQLDISGCDQLINLRCQITLLSELDLSGNPALRELICDHNQLTSLDLTNNPLIQTLECQNNPLQSLSVSNLKELKVLSFSDTQVKDIDLSNNPELFGLNCGRSQITSLDLSNNLKLGILRCNGNDLTELDVSHNQKLNHLYAEGCNLTSIDLTQNPMLSIIELWSNNLEQMPDFSGMKRIHALKLHQNRFDCEDWQEFRKQNVLINRLTFLPQSNQDLSDCLDDINNYKELADLQ